MAQDANGTTAGKSSAVAPSSSSSEATKRTTRSTAQQDSIATGLFPHESADVLAPKSEHWEFGGPLGCLFVTTSVPVTTYALFYFCNEENGCSVPPQDWRAALAQMSAGVAKSFFDGKAWAIYFAWYAFCVLAWAFIPGPWVDGVELRTGVKLQYKINGVYSARRRSHHPHAFIQYR